MLIKSHLTCNKSLLFSDHTRNVKAFVQEFLVRIHNNLRNATIALSFEPSFANSPGHFILDSDELGVPPNLQDCIDIFKFRTR